jgi:hypothetical protein
LTDDGYRPTFASNAFRRNESAALAAIGLAADAAASLVGASSVTRGLFDSIRSDPIRCDLSEEMIPNILRVSVRKLEADIRAH